MHHVWIVLIGLVFLGLFIQVVSRPAAQSSWPVVARPVMSDVESKLYARLVKACPDRVVFPQVQLCRFIEVRNVRKRYAILNRYNRLSADFVLSRPDTAVDLVVELDDASHENVAARSKDARKDAVLKAAGIRIVRLHVRSLPSVEEIRALLAASG